MLCKAFSGSKSLILFLFTVFVLLQLVFSAQDPGFGVDVGDEYLVGDVVGVEVSAPEGATVNLSIIAPDDSTESFFFREIGSFTHLYEPPVAGLYCVSAQVFFGNKSRAFDTCFSVVSPVTSTSTSTTLEEVTSTATTSTWELTSTSRSLPGVGIKVDKRSYVVGDVVGVEVSAPEGATVNLSIIAPDDSTESFFLREIGSFTHLYEPPVPGEYNVSAEVFYGNASVLSVKDFLVDDDSGVKLSPLNRFNVSVLGIESGGDGCEVDLSVGKSFISLALRDVSDLRNVRASGIKSALVRDQLVELHTDVVALDVSGSSRSTLSLRKHGEVNVVLKCVDYDFSRDECGGWVSSGIPFTDNGSHISFSVDSFSAYAGAYITIINVQSYPTVGGNWTVWFNTTGVADLLITAVNGTTWSNVGEECDLRFLWVGCGNKTLNHTWVNSSVFVENYSCDGVGYETSKVLTPGIHILKFRFADIETYARGLVEQSEEYKKGRKIITLRSKVMEELYNITTYTKIPNLNFKPKIYHITDGSRIDVTNHSLYNVRYLDTNNDNLYDRVEWNVPELSEQVFEIDISATYVQCIKVGRAFENLGIKNSFQDIELDIDADRIILPGEKIIEDRLSFQGRERSIFELDHLDVDVSYEELNNNPKSKNLGNFKRVKQTISLKNTHTQDITIALTLRQQITADKIIWNKTEYRITRKKPETFKAYDKTASIPEFARDIGRAELEGLEEFKNYQHTYKAGALLSFTTPEEKKAFYDWSDVAELDHEVRVYKTEKGIFIELTLKNITVKAKSSYVIDPIYGLLDESNYNIRYDGGAGGDHLTSRGAIAIGDVNNDSSNDLVLGAPYADNNGADSGSAWVIFGGSAGTNPSGNSPLNVSTNYNIRYDGGAEDDCLTHAGEIAIGDVNNDSSNDLVLGADYADNNGADSGSAWVIFSSLIDDVTGTGNNKPLNVSTNYNIRYDGGAGGDHLTYRGTIAIGDVNNDSSNDLVLGADSADNNGASSGSAWVIFSSLIDDVTGTGNNKPLSVSTNYNIRYDGGAGGDHLTHAGEIAIGDVNNDSSNDLVLGADSADNNGADSGSAWVIFSHANITTAPNNLYESNDASVSPSSPGTEGPPAALEKVRYDDGVHWRTALSQTDNGYDSQVFKFKPDFTGISDPNISIRWNGYGDSNSSCNVSLHVWNFNSSSWEQLDKEHLGSDGNLSGYRTGFDYNDSSGYLWIWVKADNEYSPPVISGVSSGLPGSYTATITWDTDIPADAMVAYDTISHSTGGWDDYPWKDNDGGEYWNTAHSITLTELSDSTTYYYRVRSADADGDAAVSAEFSFTTSSACSLLYTWNGTDFVFIRDIGTSSLGRISVDGGKLKYEEWEKKPFYEIPSRTVRPDSYTKIESEHLKPEDDYYDIRVTAEQDELEYIDEMELWTVDHQPDVEVYPDWTYRDTIYSVKNPKPPLSAIDHRGRDVLSLISDKEWVTWTNDWVFDFSAQVDNHTKPGGWIILKVGNWSQAPDNLKLVITEWRERGNSAVNNKLKKLVKNGAISKGGVSEVGSENWAYTELRGGQRIQIKDASGNWTDAPLEYQIRSEEMADGKLHPVRMEFMPATYVVNLAGLNISGNKVRLLIQDGVQRIHIDQILVDTSPPEDLVIEKLKPIHADLHFRGVNPEVARLYDDNCLKTLFNYTPSEEFFFIDYNSASPETGTRSYLSGNLTRYGDVIPLLEEPDDEFIIMERGDELRLRFNYTPPENRLKRDFVFYSYLYYKTHKKPLSHSVEPLPFKDMSMYPYNTSVENYDYDKHKEYLDKYQTREVVKGRVVEKKKLNIFEKILRFIPNLYRHPTEKISQVEGNSSDTPRKHHSLNTDYLSINVSDTGGDNPPTVTLVAPGDNSSWVRSLNVSFTYNVTDDGSIVNCSLYINGVWNKTNETGVVQDQNNTFTPVFNTNGGVNWSVHCFDDEGLEGDSSIWNLSLDVPMANYTEFNCSTTDFNTQPDISNISNAVLEVCDHGKIKWLNTVNASNTDFNKYVNITFNLISISTANLHSSFNASANLSLYNLSYHHNPVILRDGVVCSSPTCSFIGYDPGSGILRFNVTGFTSYASGSNSNLTVWDSTDSETKYAGEQVIFYANYTNKTSGESINGSNVYCNISFNVSPNGPYTMAFNSSTLLYEYNRSFTSSGSYSWNVSCNGSIQGFEELNVTDDVVINDRPPGINFTSPTPPNDTTTANTSVEINVSITNASDLDEVKFNWNGTNFTIFNDSLVLMMNFDNVSALGENYNNSNGTVIIDVSDFGNNGTLYVGADGSGDYTTGKFSGAYTFDGSDDYIELTNTSLFDTSSAFSIQAWIYPTAWGVGGSFGMIFGKTSAGTADFEFYIRNADDNIAVYDESNGEFAESTTNSISLNIWQYVIVTHDGAGTVKFYINGNDVSSDSTASLTNPTGNSYIGAEDATPTYGFVGTIDEIRVWNRSLSASEVQQLYFMNLRKYDVDKWSLYVNQSYDEPLGSAVYTYFASAEDDSGNENVTETRTLNVNAVSPGINFTSPTPPNDTTTANTSVEINVSITNASDLDEVKFNWNGTNFTIFNDSLVLMMNFDNVSALGESYNSTEGYSILDVSGYGNNGTAYANGSAVNGPVWDSSGRYGGAFKFDGVDDYIEIPSDSSLNPGNITVSVWVYFNSLSGRQDFVSKHSDVPAQGYALFKNASNNLVWSIRSGSWIDLSGGTVSAGKWYYVTGIVDGSGMYLFVDGVLINNNSNTSYDAGSISLNIGRHPDDGFYFNGSIDEVRIWNRSLSASEVQQLYFMNLRKYDVDKWSLYVNQSLNTSDGLPEGVYTYQASAKDTAGNLNQTEQREITIDTTEPSIQLSYPGDGDNLTSSSVNFTWTVSDNLDIMMDCNLTLDGAVNASISCQNASPCNYTVSVSDGTHYWNITCRDDAGNINTSETRSFTIDTTPPDITLTYPGNGANITTTRQPDFIFNVTDNLASTLTCELFLNRTDTGLGTPQGYGRNTSVLNDTSTTIQANTSLDDGYYDWWINCSDQAGNENQSEVRNLSIQVSALECSSCGECSDIIQNMSQSGDTVRLTANITGYAGANDTTNPGESCIKFGGRDNITFDCDGRTIEGDGDSYGYGIWLSDSDSGSDNNTIKNCVNISYFHYGIYLTSSSNSNTLQNITANDNNAGIRLYQSSNNTLRNITANNNKYYGIQLYSSSNSNTLQNITANNNKYYGIYLDSSSNSNTLQNITANNNNNTGIRLYQSSNNTLRNITANNNKYYGIQLYSSSNSNTLQNITANNNNNTGIYLYQSSNNTLQNITLQENNPYDFYISASQDSECNNLIENITGSGGRPIEYYNYSADIRNKTLSELILCDADNSNITNITIIGSATKKNNLLYIHRTENTSISEVNSSYNYYGIQLYSSSNNTLRNITANNNTGGIQLYSSSNSNILWNITANNNDDGIYLWSSSNNTLRNITANNNDYGILLYSSSNNKLRNITANNNDYGILLYWSSNSNTLQNITVNNNNQYGILIWSSSNSNTLRNITVNNNNQYGIHLFSSDSNTINSSRIENNTVYGIYIDSSTSDYNIFYNNYFNNTNNSYIPSGADNYWNTSLNCTSGTNIIGGSCIGGNYWTNPSGTGWSDNCSDSNRNGVCDEPYNLSNGNWDYLPLTENLPPNITSVSATPLVQGYGLNVSLQANVSDASGVSAVWVEVTSPGGSPVNYSMSNISADLWVYSYQDWSNGTYSYRIYANDSNGALENSSIAEFNLTVDLDIKVRTLRSAYSTGDVNLTYELIHKWTNVTDPTASLDNGEDVAVDSEENVYVTGYCDGCGSQGGYAIYTMKFNSSGDHLWTNITDPTAGTDEGYGVAVDSEENVYVTGVCDGCGSQGNAAIYTMKFNSSGDHLWTNITDPTASFDYGEDVAVDSEGNVYVTGVCDGCGSQGLFAIYTMKFNSSGSHLWTNITDPTASFDDGQGVAVDSEENVYVTGVCDGCGSQGNAAIYTMKFNSSGDHLWTNITDPTAGTDEGYGVAVDSEENVYVTGVCDGCGSQGNAAIYTMKFNSSGDHLWTNITDPTASFDYGQGVAVDSEENVYVTGVCDGCGSLGGYAIHTLGFDSESSVRDIYSTNSSLYVLMEVDYWNGTGWELDDVVVNGTAQRTVNTSDMINLWQLFNGLWSVEANASFGDGTYRVYAAALDNESNVLLNLDGTPMNDSWEFTLDQPCDIYCFNCSNCSDAIAAASPGETVCLAANLTGITTTCIDFNGSDNISFTCQGNSINGTDTDFTYGIYLRNVSGGSNYNVVRDCSSSNFFYGVYLEDGHGNTLYNLSTSDNCWLGIYLESSSGNSLSNLSSDNTSYGIYLLSSSGNNLSNLSSDNNVCGLFLSSSSSNNLHTLSLSNNSFGVYLVYSSNNSLVDVNVSKSAGQMGLYVKGFSLLHYSTNNFSDFYVNNQSVWYYGSDVACPDHQVIDLSQPPYLGNVSHLQLVGCVNVTVRNGVLNNLDGIYLSHTNDSQVSNVSVSNTYAGVGLDYSFFNVLDDLETDSNVYGVSLLASSVNNLSNISADGGYGFGIYLFSSLNNSFRNVSVSGGDTGFYLEDGSDGNRFMDARVLKNNFAVFFHWNSSGNLFIDSVLNDSNKSDVYMDAASAAYVVDNSFLNVSFRLDNVTFIDCDSGDGDTCVLHVRWYAGTQVNYSNGSAVSGETVYGFNQTGGLVDFGVTDGTGFVCLNLSEVDLWDTSGGTTYGGNRTYHSNYTINVSDGVYSDFVYVNMSMNRQIQLMLGLPPSTDLAELYPVAPVSTDDLLLNVTCTDPDNTSLVAYWFAWNDSVQTMISGSQAVANGTETEITVVGSGNTSAGENWTLEMWCSDGLSNTSHQNTSVRTIQNTPPTISLVYPLDNSTWNLSALVVFTYNVSDLEHTIQNCSLYLNGVRNKTESVVAEGMNQTINTTLPDGVYNWSIHCFDSLNLEGVSVEWGLVVNASLLHVEVNAPVNTTYPVNQTLLDTLVAGGSGFYTCVYSLDDWVTNATYDCSTAVLNCSEGFNTVWVGVNDSSGAWVVDSVNFSVDSQPPQVTLLSPADGSVDADTNVVFRYTASDTVASQLNCTLYHNVSGIFTENGSQLISSGATGSFTRNNLPDGGIVWNILCDDSYHTAYATGNWSLTINSSAVDLYLGSGDIVFSNDNPTEGNNVDVTVTVHNGGVGSYSSFQVRFLVDNVTQDTNTMSVGGGATNSTAFTWTAVKGDHTVTIAVDPLNAVSELNESNNNASRGIIVSGAGSPDEDMFISVEGDCVNESVTISLEDDTGDPLEDVHVEVYYDGGEVFDDYTDGSGEVSFVPESAGSYDVDAEKTGYSDVSDSFTIDLCVSCTDGVQNQDETDIDCGGSICPACEDGGGCMVDEDCVSGWCFNGSCRTSTCVDGIQGPAEVGVDCGGPCPPCGSCNDSILNQDETDVDCGGSICPPCGDGDGCLVDEDCESGYCYNGTCMTPTCFDGIINQDETDVDCGGLICPPCGDGSDCSVDADCVSGYCYNGTCVTPSCFDGIMNQDESGVDCGGSCVPCHCFNGLLDEDESGVDCGGSCPPCGCFNGLLDGNESDVDCGGSCPPCGDGNSCVVDSDCISGWCYYGVCETPSCSDGFTNQGEEGVDCGGPCLPCHCFNRVRDANESGVDCGGECPPCRKVALVVNVTEGNLSFNKTITLNVTPLCLNMRLDRGESDIDCGGPCLPCMDGRNCSLNSDCVNGWCYYGVCRSSFCDDLLLGPLEEKIDCGGPCDACPYLKLEEEYVAGENVSLVVINPRKGLLVKIIHLGDGYEIVNVSGFGLSSYWVMSYVFNRSGVYSVDLIGYGFVGYDSREVRVRSRSVFVLPTLPAVSEEAVRSLLVPLLVLAAILLYFMGRRKDVVADGSGLQGLVDSGRIKSYGRVYTTYEVAGRFPDVDNLEVMELSEAEVDRAEDLVERFDVSLDEARLLVLCNKLRAKTFFVRGDFPEEVDGMVKSVRVVRAGSGPGDYMKIGDEVSGKRDRELRQGRGRRGGEAEGKMKGKQKQ